MLGGLTYAAAMASFAYYAKRFTDGTLVHIDPRTIIWLPLALVGLLFLRSMGTSPRPTSPATSRGAWSPTCASRCSTPSSGCRSPTSTATPAATCCRG